MCSVGYSVVVAVFNKQPCVVCSDVMEMYGYPGVSLGNPQLFLQQNIPLANRNPMYKVPASHTLLPAVSQLSFDE